MTTVASPAAVMALADDLDRLRSGLAARPQTPEFVTACGLWNAAVTHRPVLTATPVSTEETAAVVRAAVRHGVPLSVKGGGHDWAGRALRDGGLVIDLSHQRGIVIDPQARSARVGGGVLAGMVVAAAEDHGLVATTGTIFQVGLTGLTLGGGYGLLTGAYGLALDNLLSATVVMADGGVMTASAGENPDLFWALRGGGGNFGVVTDLTVRLHVQPQVLSGAFLFTGADIRPALEVWAEVTASAPPDLTMMATLLTADTGDTAVVLIPVWCGDPAAGEALLKPLESIGTPLYRDLRLMTYRQALGMFRVAEGHHYAIRTRNAPDLTVPLTDVLLDGLSRRTVPGQSIVLHRFHGAAAAVAPDATAFGLRQPHILMEFVAGWDHSETAGAAGHIAWAEALSQAVAAHALPGGYPNLLGPEAQEQSNAAFADNRDRLLDLKQRFDPDGVFSSALSLPGPAPALSPLS